MAVKRAFKRRRGPGQDGRAEHWSKISRPTSGSTDHVVEMVEAASIEDSIEPGTPDQAAGAELRRRNRRLEQEKIEVLRRAAACWTSVSGKKLYPLMRDASRRDACKISLEVLGLDVAYSRWLIQPITKSSWSRHSRGSTILMPM